MCTLNGNIDYLLYENLVGQPKLIQICMCGEIFVFLSFMIGLLVVSILKFVLNHMANRD